MWGGDHEKFATFLACILTLYAVNRWLSVRFNLYSAVIIGLASFVTILTPTIDAARAGFILAFASTVTIDVSAAFAHKMTY
jgi:membrane protein YdbS with pleckstrin-like domain